MLLGTHEQFTRRQRDPIGTRTIERLRSTVLDRRRVRHVGDDSLGHFDWIVLVGFDLRQPVEHGLRQVALFEIPNPIGSQNETAARFLGFVEVFRVSVVLRVRTLIDLPKDDDVSMLAPSASKRRPENPRLLGARQRRFELCHRRWLTRRARRNRLVEF
jgi:hypothetical protein